MPGRVHLRPHHPLNLLSRQRLDHTVVQHTRRVDDGGDGRSTEPRAAASCSRSDTSHATTRASEPNSANSATNSAAPSASRPRLLNNNR
ncbi:hypothetical protein NKH77_43915 [Streptomyces sp. M19]